MQCKRAIGRIRRISQRQCSTFSKWLPSIRSEFPGIVQHEPAVIADGAGGSQIHQSAIDAMTKQLTQNNANVGGTFPSSTGVLDTFAGARETAATFLNANSSREIVFGNNMTTLAQSLSRALAHRIEPGSEIIVSEMDHDANVSPWLHIAKEKGCTVKWIKVDTETFRLDMESLANALSDRTFIVALGYASNLIGTVNDVKRACKLSKEAGALSFIDAVHYAPHGLIDVQEVGCDFLACSPYKFFGPHTGSHPPKIIKQRKTAQFPPQVKSIERKLRVRTSLTSSSNNH